MPFGFLEYLFRWERVNRDLSSRWDRVIGSSPHRNLDRPLVSDRYFREAIIRFARPWISPGSAVLKFDLYNEATGTQELARWLAAEGGRVTGVDISPVAAHLARGRLRPERPGATGLVAGDIRRLPFRDGVFDLVFSFGTIEHVREVREAVREAVRVLKANGRIVLFVNNLYNLFAAPLWNLLLSPWLKKYTSFEPAFTPARVRGWMEHAGLRVLAQEGIIFLPKPFRYLELAAEGLGPRPLRTPARGLTRAGVALARALEHLRPLRWGGEMIAIAGEKGG